MHNDFHNATFHFQHVRGIGLERALRFWTIFLGMQKLALSGSKQLLDVATSSRNDLGLLLTFRNINRSLELCASYGVGVTDDIYDKLHNLRAEFICDVGHFSWFCCSCYCCSRVS